MRPGGYSREDKILREGDLLYYLTYSGWETLRGLNMDPNQRKISMIPAVVALRTLAFIQTGGNTGKVQDYVDEYMLKKRIEEFFDGPIVGGIDQLLYFLKNKGLVDVRRF